MSGAAKACLILGGLFALAALAWMVFLPSVVERELRSATGFDVRVAILAANPFTGRVVARGLLAHNPPEYPVPDFVDLRELQVEASIFSWVFTDRIVFDEIYADAAKLELVRQHNGRSNAGDFIAAFSRSRDNGPGAAAAVPSKPTQYLIRRLRIRLDQLVIADYSGAKPDETTYKLNIDHTFSNVSKARQLLVPEVVRSLDSFGLHHDAAKLLPGDFGLALADALGGAARVGGKLRDAGQKTGEYLKGLLDKLEQSAKP